MKPQDTTAQNEQLYNRQFALIKRFAFYLSCIPEIYIIPYCYNHADLASAIAVTLISWVSIYVFIFLPLFYLLICRNSQFKNIVNKIKSCPLQWNQITRDYLPSYSNQSSRYTDYLDNYCNPSSPLYWVYNPTSHLNR